MTTYPQQGAVVRFRCGAVVCEGVLVGRIGTRRGSTLLVKVDGRDVPVRDADVIGPVPGASVAGL